MKKYFPWALGALIILAVGVSGISISQKQSEKNTSPALLSDVNTSDRNSISAPNNTIEKTTLSREQEKKEIPFHEEFYRFGRVLEIKNDTLTMKELGQPDSSAFVFVEKDAVYTVGLSKATLYSGISFDTSTLVNGLPTTRFSENKKENLKKDNFVIVSGTWKNSSSTKDGIAKEIVFSSSTPNYRPQ